MEWWQSLRSLRRSPWYALTVIGVIALSTTIATTVFAVVDGVLFKPLPYRHVRQLFVVDARVPAGTGRFMQRSFHPDDMHEWGAAVPGLTLTGLNTFGRFPLGDGVNEPAFGVAEVDRAFFNVIGMAPMAGGFADEDFQPSAPGAARPIIVSFEVWQRRFGGDASLIGRRLVADPERGLTFTVAGIMPRGFVCPVRGDVQVLLPFVRTPAAGGGRSAKNFSQLLARVPDDTNPDVIAQRVAVSMRATDVGAPPAPAVAGRGVIKRPGSGTAGSGAPELRVQLVPVGEYLRAGDRPVFLAVFAAALVLLFLSAVNVSGLMASRAESRGRELAVLRALGADAFAITRRILAESAALVAAGTVVGLVLAKPALAVTARLLPSGRELALLKAPVIDWRVVGFAVLVGALSIVAASVWPIRRALVASIAAGVAGGGQSTSRVSRFGRVAVALQIGAGVALALAGSLIVMSLVHLWRTDPGFAYDDVITVELRLRERVTPATAGELTGLVDRVASVPGVAAVGLNGARVLSHGGEQAGFEPPPDALPDVTVLQYPVTPGFFDVTRPRVIDGRLPTHDEFDRGDVIVVSGGLARAYWPGRPAVGQILSDARGGTYTVAAVVADARYLAWDFPPEALVYVPYARFARTQSPILFVKTAGRRDRVLAEIVRRVDESRASWRATRVATLEDLLTDTIRSYRFQAWLFGGFAAGALTLLGVGVLGLVAMTTSRRTREMGIRVALGARPGAIVGLMLREQLVAAAAGLAIGALLSVWSVRFLRFYLYGLTPYDAGAWLVTAVIVLIVTVIGTSIPAIRASRVDPVRALRVD